MIEIKDLLGRLRDILLGEEDKKEAVRKAIISVIKVEISSENVKIKNGTIFLNIKPIYKNEILIKKEQIFARMQDLLGKKSPKDIR